MADKQKYENRSAYSGHHWYTVPSELFIKVTIVEKDPVFRKNKNRTACSGHQIMTFQI